MESQGLSFHLMTVALLLLAVEVVAAALQPAPWCPTTCGNVSIPFPFGTSPDCYLDESFLIFCNNTYNPPKPTLAGEVDVYNISFDGHLKTTSWMAYDCYEETGSGISDIFAFLRLKNFFISSTRNRFTAVGCDTYAFVRGSWNRNYTTGCTAVCYKLEDAEDGSCDGIGCCEMSIPEGVNDFRLTVNSYDNHTAVHSFNPCGYAFVAEVGYYRFSRANLMDLQNKEGRANFPVVLEWSIGNLTCQEAKRNSSTYACQAENSECYNSTTRQGYLCRCSPGFEGNPYLKDGCQDINECDISNPCSDICTDLPGSFSCSCPKGYEGDGKKVGVGCRRKRKAIGTILLYVAIGVISSILVFLVASALVYCVLREKKLSKMREKFFRENGGLLLQQKLVVQNDSMGRDIIFTQEDLKKATDNYDNKRVIGQGGFGTVYKGVLPDNRVVAIKKSKVSDESQIEQFINEVAILSQINHRNVVKLLGCCLETEVPLLVYEFISNGTLYNHIHDENLSRFFTWDLRLKVAAETAGALAYLHSAASVPIIHRDVKSGNILLDSTYTTKVSDFGASRFIPVDQSEVTTLVQGTFGYLDPEYFHSSQLTEKSDVYSFGVVLAELLTGEKAYCFNRTEKEKNLAILFVTLVEENKWFRILDKRLEERNVQQIQEVAKLAKRCLSVKSEDRPTMKEVAMELEGLRLMQKHSWIESDLYPEETQCLLNSSAFSISHDGFIGKASGSNTTVKIDSMRDQIVQLDDGR